jgi:hypothetical protein
VTSFNAAKGVLTTAVGAETISGLGFRPLAVVAWWSRQDGHGTEHGNRGGIGFWTAAECASVAWASEDAASPTRTRHIAESAALLGLAGPGGDVAMRAGVDTFDVDGLTLRWATRPSETWVIHFLALGGASLRSAGVGWTSEAPTAGGVDAVLEGLRADLVLVLPVAGPTIGIGAASRRGRAAAGYAARDGSAPGVVTGAQRSDAAIVSVDGQPRRACYLALEGVRATVGIDSSPTRPGTKRTRAGFRPDALLLFSWGLAASHEPKAIGRLCLGGASGIESGCSSWDDRNVEAGETATHAHSSTEHALVVTDTQTGGIHARAKLVSVDERGFTLDWTESDGKSREFAYVTLTGRRPDGPARRLARALGRT